MLKDAKCIKKDAKGCWKVCEMGIVYSIFQKNEALENNKNTKKDANGY
jgi:hypothetical protein